MPTTPRTHAMQRFHNTLSLGEADFLELRQNKLREDDTVQKLRASTAKLESRIDKLSQTNEDLRDHLSTTREELEQRERDTLTCPTSS